MLRLRKLFFIILPLHCISQQQSSIKFSNHLTWKQALTQAKDENKYIFVDCFASWCVPCKEMDIKVYSMKEVYEPINKDFISIKLQADTTAQDGADVKKWYAVAKEMLSKYKVNAFPTYLFFSPNGKLVHRDAGFKKPKEFVSLIGNVRSPEFQVYTLLRKYKKGQLPFSEMPRLAANVSELLSDKKVALQIKKYYLENYLNGLPIDQLMSNDNLDFIGGNSSLLSTKDHVFKLLYKEWFIIDSVTKRKGWSAKIVNTVISKEEIYSKIFRSGKWIKHQPSWERLSQTIEAKYGVRWADESILNAKIYWYNRLKKFDSTIKYEIIRIDKYGQDTSMMGCFFTNNMVYELIFKHSNDTIVLNKAMKWMTVIVDKYSTDGSYIDTYANLLYKAGRLSEAIMWQEKAVMVSPKDKDIKLNLAKMKKNEPTWVND